MSSVVTSLRDVHGRALVALPLAVRQALRQADEVLRLHGMQFELICETCHQRTNNPNGWTVTARHGADGSLSELVCPCTRRTFQQAF